MKRYFNHSVVLLLLSVVSIVSCSKKEETPKDFITCDVNGKPWSAAIVDPNWPFGISYLGNNMFMLEGGSASTGIPSVKIVLRDPSSNNNSSGTFALKAFERLIDRNYGGWYDKRDGYAYFTDSTHTGTFTMTFDNAKKRASGTFAFKAAYRDSVTGVLNEVEITNGKFSTGFQQLQ